MNIPRGKAICKLYHDGFSLTEISKAVGIDHSQVDRYLKSYYEKIYDEKYQPYAIKHAKFLEELYNKYQQVYQQGVYTRTELCELLGCKPVEFEAMTRKYKLHHQWLQTYHKQKTLCNVSEEFFNDVAAAAKKYKYRSVRALATHAINEYLLYLAELEKKARQLEEE